MKTYDIEAIEYLAKLAEGGLRDAITLMDKAMSFSDELTLENVVNALGTTDYETMFKLTDSMIDADGEKMIEIIESIHASGKDLKQFVHLYTNFLLDVQKYAIGCDFSQLQIPQLKEYEEWLSGCGDSEFEYCQKLLENMITLNSDIKYSSYPKADVEAKLLILCLED